MNREPAPDLLITTAGPPTPLKVGSKILRFLRAPLTSSSFFGHRLGGLPQKRSSGMVMRLQQTGRDSSARMVIEYFAGEGGLTKACCDMGMKSSRWDKSYSESHDVLTEVGLRTWLNEHAHSALGCLVWLGTQCSSFLLICKAVSMRDKSNDYLGNRSRQFVKSGNAMMEVTALLYFLSFLTDCRPVVEQPLQSCMFKIKPLSTVMRFTHACRIECRLLKRCGSEVPGRLFQIGAGP